MPKIHVSLPENADYGDICREFVRRACFLHRLSRADLAERLGIQDASIGTQVYRGQLGFEKAMVLAELAHATDEECAATHMAWLSSRGRTEAKRYTRRSFQMLMDYREEVDRFDSFLKEKGLFDEYMTWRGGPKAEVRASMRPDEPSP
jgi:transcriptional regulator with XRE-family HTH domain